MTSKARTLSPDRQFKGHSLSEDKFLVTPISKFRNLKIVVPLPPERKEKEVKMEDCVVCLENNVPEDKKTNCGHYICPTCVCDLNELICPYCRTILTKVSFSRGFDELQALVVLINQNKKAEEASKQFIQAEQAAQGQNIQYDI
jgi:hypothetical protein